MKKHDRKPIRPINISPYFLEKLSLLTFILTTPFGDEIIGSLTIANVGQVISFAMLVPAILPRLTKRYITYNWLGFAMMFLSSAIATLRYNIPFHIMHISFFTLISLYLSFFTMRVREEPEFANMVVEHFELCAYLLIIPFVWMAYNGIVVQQQWRMAYFFDDKSHAVIFFDFLAFLSLSLRRRGKLPEMLKYGISVAYFIISLTTSSRLGIIFVPFYAIAFCRNFSRSNKVLNRLVKVIIAVSLLTGVVFAVSRNVEYFSVFRRVSHSQGSTGAHLLLIRYALQMKVSDVAYFLLGIGPGNFGGILTATGFDMSEMWQYDRSIIYSATHDYLVVHSSHLQILVDFSLYAFFCYVRFLFTIFQRLWTGRHINEFLFLIAFIGAETFYSTSNEGIFWAILLYLFVKTYAVSESKSGH